MKHSTNLRIARGQGLDQGVVKEDVLLLGLDQVVPLAADVLEEAVHVKLLLGGRLQNSMNLLK